jgi:hypothetical protein
MFFVNFAELDDWLGIYSSSADNNDLGDAEIAWMWTCGNKECRGMVSSNNLAFMNIFDMGTFKIHLI